MKKCVMCVLLATLLVVSLSFPVLADGDPFTVPKTEIEGMPNGAVADEDVSSEAELTSSVDAIPATDETPDPEETPDVEETSDAEETPDTEEIPDAEKTPDVEETPNAEETPATEEISDTEKTPDTEEMPNTDTVSNMEPIPAEPVAVSAAEEGGKLIVNDEYDAILSIVDANGKPLKSGDAIPESGATATVKSGYVLSGICTKIDPVANTYSIPRLSPGGVFGPDQPDSEVSVSLGAVIHFAGAVEGLASGTGVVDGESVALSYGYAGENRTVIDIELKADYSLENTGYIENAYVTDLGYTASGGELSHQYGMTPINHGTITLNIVSSGDKPGTMPVTVIDNYQAFDHCPFETGDIVPAGSVFELQCKEGYAPHVLGATLVSRYWRNYTYRVNGDAERLIITSHKAANGTLTVTGYTDAVVSDGSDYCLENGSSFSEGILYLKPEYRLDTVGEFDHYLIVDEGYVYLESGDGIFAGVYHSYYISTEISITVNVIDTSERIVKVSIGGTIEGIDNGGVRLLEGDVIYGDGWYAVTGGTVTIRIKKGYSMQVTTGGVIESSAHYGGYYADFWEYNVKVNSDTTELAFNIVESKGVLGDITGEGDVAPQDATELFRIVNKQVTTAVDVTVADVNHDGEVDAKDATQLFWFINKQITVL